MRVIESAIAQTRAGRGDVLLIAGEPGIGKSTLARHASDIAANEGVGVFWGFTWEIGVAPAYWPWTQVLRSLLAQHQQSEKHLGRLGQLLPEAATADGPTLNHDQARFQLMETTRSLLDEASQTKPLLLIFEDLHAADSDSLQLLHFVSRHVRNLPILIVATYRELEARDSADMTPLWQLTRDAKLIRPERLTPDEIRSYLLATGRDADETLLQQLINTTSGNPLFVQELADLINRQDEPGWRLPDTVHQVIDQQVNRLAATTIHTLEAASVLGRRFDARLLERLLGKNDGSASVILAQAIDAQILHTTSEGNFEFSHALYRDVLYQRLSASERQRLHREQATLLRAFVDAGDQDRWLEVAIHLAGAGPEFRPQLVHAWRAAGQRAIKKLAFDEAVQAYERALTSFGDGPSASPVGRCELKLELASAMMARGDIEAAHEHCVEAYETAKMLEQPELMAEAGLTYGRSIMVATIDKWLVSSLRESLNLLDDAVTSLRARVAARLAAAMQPAEDPQEPMQMARDSIALARGTNDAAVIYDVLRSAISALMDFAPAEERASLNREFEVLAKRENDVPGQFRCNLRLVIDASELGDHRMMDESIRACEAIAEKIGLPHYKWRVASILAMRESIKGNFRQATVLLQEAEALADLADDVGAMLTIPIQRFAIIYDWDSPDAVPFDVIEKQLRGALRMLPEAEAYASPMFASFAYRSGQDELGATVTDPAVVERLFAGGDRFCVGRLGEVAITQGDMELIRRSYELLLPYEDSCATMGLLGTHWAGPVGLSLGMLAAALGDHQAAAAHYAVAMKIAHRMGARPVLARILAGMADLAEASGDTSDARRLTDESAELVRELELRPLRKFVNDEIPETLPATAAFSMRLDGDVWTVAFAGKTALMRTTKGLAMLSRLIEKPDQELHVLDLAGANSTRIEETSIPSMDHKARQDYKLRINDLNDELEELHELGDSIAIDRVRSEIDFITKELARAFGLGGRDRPSGTAAERARVNVRRRLTDAMKRLDVQLPGVGRYLQNTVKTGSYCRYEPM